MARTVALCLVLLLAGCLTSSDDPVTPVIGVVTDPKDLSAQNSTGSHVHDYWGGERRIEVVNASMGSSWNTVGGGFWRRAFLPVDEVVVPQGTASINVTVRWADGTAADAYGVVSLWVKPADTVEPRYVQDVASGDRVEIPVLYAQADLPHQLVSAWEFIVQFNASSQPYSAFFGTTWLTATAHRGLDLQPFPAHPDRWQGRSEFTLVDVTDGYLNVGYTGTGNLAHIIRAADGALVPPDAARVQVDFEALPSPPTPAPLGFVEVQFHGADTRAWTTLGVVSTAAPAASWDIVVAAGMGDGPYGDASQWQFRVATPNAFDTSSPSADASAYAGGFHLVVTVHR